MKAYRPSHAIIISKNEKNQPNILCVAVVRVSVTVSSVGFSSTHSNAHCTDK